LVALKGKHGAMLAGRYRLLEQLGVGGMGSVWKAEHLVLHSHVAIKIVDPDVARLEFNLARFLREAKTLASLRSPNVVQVLDFGSDADTPYLVMELLEGQTLGSRLTKKGRLSLAETSHVLRDVCTAMSLVHEQGLIHRDLKPDNIFLCEVGEQRITKIVDFGIAKSMRPDLVASMKTRTGHMLGTPSYMSPEQCRGLKDIDHRADLWALGVIAYECLVGKVPFEGAVLGDLLLRICMDPLPIPSRQVKGGLPDAFDAWFAKAVARDREVRFQSALELATTLAELAPPTEHASSSGPDVREPARSSPQHSSPQHSSPRWSASLAGPLPQPTSRPTPNTETNTSVGLGAMAAFAVGRRSRLYALGAVALAAALSLWAFGGGKPDVEAHTSVGVQSLRPQYVATPKVLRQSVPTGRRWQPTSTPAGGLGPGRASSAQPVSASSSVAAAPSVAAASSVPAEAGVPSNAGLGGAPSNEGASGAPSKSSSAPAGGPAPKLQALPLTVPGGFTSVAPGDVTPADPPAPPEEVAPEGFVAPAPPSGSAEAPSGAAQPAPPASRPLRGTAAPGAPARAPSGTPIRPGR
jgi:eukaryotic-like serine/threonine-protein kinase